MHWRNFEAGYDVAELEPPSRMHRTYVLQEYFVPVEELENFVPKMQEILRRHRVNALNISIRHAMPDTETMLGWAPRETFAFVLYHKQRTRENAKSRVGVWTRELIDAALAVGGTYYLPYQPHATIEQFHRAYPRAREFFALKWEVDPDFRFTNVLWDKYYRAWLDRSQPEAAIEHPSEFHRVFADVGLSDAFYRFLQTVFRTVPEDRFHHLIADACKRHRDEEAVYRYVQQELKGVKPFLSDLRYTVPSLFKQKQEMVAQTLAVLGSRRRFEGYVEIGSKARYFASLAKKLDLAGPCHFVDEHPPGFSAADILERGGVAKQGEHVPLQDYEPIAATAIGDGSVDLVTCYVGLHHMTAERLGALPRLGGADPPPRRRVHRPRPRRRFGRHAGAGLARAHGLQRRPRRDLGDQPRRAALLRAGRHLGAAPARSRLRRSRPPPAPGQRPDAERAVLLRKARRSHQHRGEPRPGRVCMSRIRRRLSGLGLAAALVCAAGPMHAADSSPSAVVRSSALTAPEDRRTPDQTFLTFPEWYLVHSPAEYARYLSRSAAPSCFPLFAHIGQFWQGYAAVNREVAQFPVQRRLSPDGDGHRQQHDRRIRAQGHLRAHHRPARRGDGHRRRPRSRRAPLRRLRPGLCRLHPRRALVPVRLPRTAGAAVGGAAALGREPDPALGTALRAHAPSSSSRKAMHG